MSQNDAQRHVAQSMYIAQIWPHVARLSYCTWKERGRGCLIIDTTRTVTDEHGNNAGHEIAYIPLHDDEAFQHVIEMSSPNMRSNVETYNPETQVVLIIVERDFCAGHVVTTPNADETPRHFFDKAVRLN